MNFLTCLLHSLDEPPSQRCQLIPDFGFSGPPHWIQGLQLKGVLYLYIQHADPNEGKKVRKKKEPWCASKRHLSTEPNCTTHSRFSYIVAISLNTLSVLVICWLWKPYNLTVLAKHRVQHWEAFYNSSTLWDRFCAGQKLKTNTLSHSKFSITLCINFFKFPLMQNTFFKRKANQICQKHVSVQPSQNQLHLYHSVLHPQ